ncbi:MAG: hypothetical protein NT157_02805 [Candidatus Micrarchaeota archaeon]|nr:hypothetical protein [Candidatus Micrarchaeota archaeon]
MRPPEICTFSPGITCKTFYLKAAKVNLTLTNGLQKPITITNATCTQQSDVGAMTWSPAFAPVLAVGVGGDAIVPAVDCRNGVGTPYTAAELPAGAGYSGKVCISYYFTAEGVTMPRIICGTGYFISA